jgi:hypothetical protein
VVEADLPAQIRQSDMPGGRELDPAEQRGEARTLTAIPVQVVGTAQHPGPRPAQEASAQKSSGHHLGGDFQRPHPVPERTDGDASGGAPVARPYGLRFLRARPGGGEQKESSDGPASGSSETRCRHAAKRTRNSMKWILRFFIGRNTGEDEP